MTRRIANDPTRGESVSEEIKKAIENLSHAVSCYQGDKEAYLFEAAKELVELVYPPTLTPNKEAE